VLEVFLLVLSVFPFAARKITLKDFLVVIGLNVRSKRHFPQRPHFGIEMNGKNPLAKLEG
jgi:hypothetical protein